MLLPALLVLCSPQEPSGQPADVGKATAAIKVGLVAKSPDDQEHLAWSPKGARVELKPSGTALVGSFALGPKGAPTVQVQLERSAAGGHFDVLSLDADRDGKFSATERLTTTAKEQRGKWWSNFTATLDVPFATPGQPPTHQPYPVALWFVEDPLEPKAPPALRWSRRGWREGQTTIDGRPVFVLLAEMDHDGIFTTADSWALAHDRKALLSASPRELASHTWLEERAFRITDIAADGSEVRFEPFDPHTTRAEEKARADVYKADREAKRAPQPLAFGKDFNAALATAKRDQKRVLVDFATTWCGPCKLMDEFVYTAADVVKAADDIVAVQLDGDLERDLVKRFQIAAYPTMLLLEPDGTECRREVGYQSVAAMVKFLAK